MKRLMANVRIWLLMKKLERIQRAADALEAEVREIARSRGREDTFRLAWCMIGLSTLRFRLGYFVGELNALKASRAA